MCKLGPRHLAMQRLPQLAPVGQRFAPTASGGQGPCNAPRQARVEDARRAAELCKYVETHRAELAMACQDLRAASEAAVIAATPRLPTTRADFTTCCASTRASFGQK